MRVGKFILLLAVTVLLVLNTQDNAYAKQTPSSETLIKAAFLYNFAKFVEWPVDAFADDQTPLTLGILGKDPFGDALETIRDKSVGGRRLEIKRSKTIQDLEKCHILFISGSEKNRVKMIFNGLKGSNTLTVGDMESFAQRGGIINFISVDKKIRFEINVDAAMQTGLKISSKLLKLARIIKNK